MRYALLSTIFLIGCSQSPQGDPRNIHGINPVFDSYVQQFEGWNNGASIGDIPIQFVPQSGNIIGMCLVFDYAWREIEIDPTYWNDEAIDDDARMSLIAHELGHCALNRGHVDTETTVDGEQIFTSWMNYFVFFSDSDTQFENYYINELFHPSPSADPPLGQSLGGPEVDEEDFIHIHTY